MQHDALPLCQVMSASSHTLTLSCLSHESESASWAPDTFLKQASQWNQ